MVYVWVAVALILGITAGWMVGHRRGVQYEEPPSLETTPPLVAPELARTVDNLTVGALLVGQHDEVLRASDAELSALLHQGDRISSLTLLEAVRSARRSGGTDELTVVIPRRPGHPERTLEAWVCPVSDELMLVQAADREELTRVDNRDRDFIANVSHELKTPIGAIVLLSEALEEAHDDPDAVTHFSERLSLEANRLSDMVSQLIDLSRLETQSSLADATPVVIEEVLDEALMRVRSAAQNKGITLLTTGESDGVVLGEEHRLVDAVSNLMLNAIAYSDHGQRVAISTRRRAEGSSHWIEIAVADHGIGIKAEDQERIFERFYRVDYGRSRSHGGTGLGLSIVRQIAQAHGGDVRVWSQLGEGSTFTIRLPEYSARAGSSETR